MADTLDGAQAPFSLARETAVVALRPRLIAAEAASMAAAFPGDLLYAVKCNPTPDVLEALWDGGIRAFDTASIAEIRLVRALLPAAACHFMHPIKSPEAIAEAYFRHGVRRFVYDDAGELTKIVQATGGAEDLELYLRLAVPGDGAVLSLTGKFGADPAEAARLLRLARPGAARLGLTFHVGSQCLDPMAFVRAIRVAAGVATEAGGIDALDVGGGFPGHYRGNEPAFEDFVAEIAGAVRETGLAGVRLQAEPGRALVASGASVFARVELRRGQALYLNDGVYGALAEVKWLGPLFPLRGHGAETALTGNSTSFDLFGPTCDSIDSMPGPHWLPADIEAGDLVEFGMMGAYSTALGTGFNGFGAVEQILLDETESWYLPEIRRAKAA